MMILDRYLFKLWVGPFIGFFLVITGLLLFGRVIRAIEVFGNNPVDWGLLLEMVLAIIPYFLTLAIPCAFFFSLLKILKSLQQNSEVEALFAAGVSPLRLLRPMLVIALIMWAFLSWTTMEWMPSSQQKYINIYNAIKKTAAMPKLIPGQFSGGFDDFNIYHVGEDENGLMHKFMLEEKRAQLDSIYISKTAKTERQGQFMILTMYDGVHLEGTGTALRSTYFSTLSISTDIGDMGVIQPMSMSTKQTLPGLMRLSELNAAMEKSPSLAVTAEWHRRWILASTVMILLLFAFPFASSAKRSGKSHEWLLGIALLLVIYNVQIALHKQVILGEFLWWGMWLGQFSFIVFGGILFLSFLKHGHIDLKRTLISWLRWQKPKVK